MPSSIWVASSLTDGMDFGSGAISLPVEVWMTDSSTPGRVGWRRSSIEKIPSSARSSMVRYSSASRRKR